MKVIFSSGFFGRSVFPSSGLQSSADSGHDTNSRQSPNMYFIPPLWIQNSLSKQTFDMYVWFNVYAYYKLAMTWVSISYIRYCKYEYNIYLGTRNSRVLTFDLITKTIHIVKRLSLEVQKRPKICSTSIWVTGYRIIHIQSSWANKHF